MKILTGFLFLFLCLVLSAQTDTTLVKNDSTAIETENLMANKDTAFSILKPYYAGNNSFDKIRLDTGDSLIVTILAETQTEVAFRYPLNTMINKMPFSKIREIAYKDGKIKAIVNQNPASGVGTEPNNLWRIVVVTYDENDVAGMKEIGPISAKAEGKTLKTKIEILEKNATLNIQKRAVRMNATKVLIKNKNIEQEYGEIPLVELEGIAYGTN
ncbi:MAG: hypothetical protein HC830_03160 [Bacteroidetes bacterium]|nr:hypothetical protein [Bacteroidales bacterium]NJO68392.1 hypothetical protein [Bacteroidota bacterium]